MNTTRNGVVISDLIPGPLKHCCQLSVINILFAMLLAFTAQYTYADEYLVQTPECTWGTLIDDGTGATINDPADELVKLATALDNDPLQIYSWVYHNIEFIDTYSSSRLGAYATYMTGHGNEWDTSSLLIALLRISGFEARYVQLGAGDTVFVEAKLGQANYRGQGLSGPPVWVQMVPWKKDYSVEKGIDLYPEGAINEGLDFDFNQYLKTVNQKTTVELYEEKVLQYLNVNHSGKTINDVQWKQSAKPFPNSLLPLSFPKSLPNALAIPKYFAAVPTAKRAWWNLYIKNNANNNILLSKQIYLSDIAGKRFVLDFIPASTADAEIINTYGGICLTPDGEAEVRPVLRINGEIVEEGLAVTIGGHFYPVYSGGGYSLTERPPAKVGTLMQIGVDPLSASEKTIEKNKIELASLSTDVILDDATREQYLGRLSKILVDTFSFRRMQNEKRLEGIFHILSSRESLSPTFVFTFPAGMLSDVESKFYIHPQWNIDAQMSVKGWRRTENGLEALAWDDQLYTLFKRLSGYTSSYNEGLIFEDWQDTQSLSTVKGLMVAQAEQGLEVETLTAVDIPILEGLKYRQNLNWDNLTSDQWHAILEYMYQTQDWGDMPAIGSSSYNARMEAVQGLCVDGTISIEMVEHLLIDFGYIPANSLKDQVIQQIIDEIESGATVITPLTLINYEGMIGNVRLSFGENHDGYYFGMDNEEIPLEGGKSSVNVVKNDIYAPSNYYSVFDPVGSNSSVFTFDNNYTIAPLSGGASKTTKGLNDIIYSFVSRVGDPVNIATGEFYTEEHSDISIRSRGLALSIVRSYKSQLIYNGPFGFGWTWNHAERIIPLEGGDIIYYGQDSLPQELQADPVQGFILPKGATYTIAKINQQYLVTRRDFITLTFDVEGRLLSKADPFSNTLTFRYDDTANPDRITAIQDNLGRALTFTYNANGKITSVTDFSGRSCEYTYAGDDLITFKDLEDNITRFEYLDGQENELNNHNLIKYILPTGDYLELGYYKNDQVAYHRNIKGEIFNFQYSRLNRYGETWNEEGYYRKVYFDEDLNEIRVDYEDGNLVQKSYDEHHNMVELIDGNGNTTIFDYGPQPELRLLHSKTNAMGETWTYAYESTLNPYAPTSVIDQLGHVTHFEYGPGGRLKKEIKAKGYAYDDSGLLVLQTDAPGLVTEYKYDDYGNLIQKYAPGERITKYTYDETYGVDLISREDANGNKTTFTYYQAGNPNDMPPGLMESKTVESGIYEQRDGFTTYYEYNQYDQLITTTDPLGGQTIQEYSLLRQPTRTILPDNSVIEHIYGPARDIVSGASIIQSIDPLGYWEEYEYDQTGNVTARKDKNGNTTRYTYDGMNRIIAVTDPMQQDSRFVYDGNGKLIRRYSKSGEEFTYSYDAAGRKISETDTEGNVTTYSYDAGGRLLETHRPDGSVIAYSYDVLNRLVEKIIGYGSAEPRIYSYGYTEAGQLLVTLYPEGNYTTYSYDKVGNKRTITYFDSNNIQLRQESYTYYPDSRNLLAKVVIDDGKEGNALGTSYEYDELGRKTAVINQLGERTQTNYDSVGNPVVVSTPSGITQTSYDLAGQLIQRIDPEGNQTDYSYDPNSNLVSTRDALGRITRFMYDSLNRKIAVIDALGEQTVYDYDANDNLIQLTDPNLGVSLFEYDRNNRLIRETQPLGQETVSTYTSLGELASVVRNGGQKAVYKYNVGGQPTEVSYFSEPSQIVPDKVVTYSYDLNGNLTGYADGITSATYTYDGLNRKEITTVNYPSFNSYPGFSKTFEYEYPDYWRQKFTGPDEGIIRSEFNEAGQLQQVTLPNGYTVDYQNYSWSGPGKITLPGITVISTIYDSLDRPIDIKVEDSVSNPLASREYSYSAVGDILGKSTEDGPFTYQYDPLSRLIHANNSTLDDEHFTYDALGNRITDSALGTLSYTQNNELDGIGTYSLSYDANGSITANPYPGREQEYEYDVTGRLERITRGGTILGDYYYDPFGRRLWKEISGIRTYFLYSDEGLIGEYDAGGIELKSYGYAPGSPWEKTPIYQKTSEGYFYFLNDHLGTPQKLVDNTGSVVWSAIYDSFGNALVDDTSTIVNNIGFPGQYWDDESELYYNWNRYYDPLVGRYLRADPLGLDAGLNFYVYVGNNPLGYVDYDGLTASKIYSGLSDSLPTIWDGGLSAVNGLPSAIANSYTPESVWAQTLSTSLYTVGDVAVKVGASPLNGIDQVVSFAKNPTASTIPIFGPTADNIARTTSNFIDDGSLVNTSEMFGAYSGGFLLSLSGAQLSRSGTGITVNNKASKRADFYVSPGGQAIPSQGYRAIGGESNIAEALGGTISSRNPTYITFDNIKGMNPQEVQNLLQLPKTPSHAVQFDTLQLLDDLSVPTGKWNTTNIPEPITTTFPKWGTGGGTQAITNKPITIDDMWRLGE